MSKHPCPFCQHMTLGQVCRRCTRRQFIEARLVPYRYAEPDDDEDDDDD